MVNVEICGLICTGTGTSVPLQSVHVVAEIKGFVSETRAVLEYRNSSSNPIEAEFTFPVDDNSAVYKFEAEVNGRTIVSEVQEREQATETYNDAIRTGHTATLLEESSCSGDIFHCKIGNLGSNSEAKVTIALVTELKLTTDGAVTFILPTVLCPRYNPNVQDGPVLEQPVDMSYTSVLSEKYSFHFEANVESKDPISNIQSPKDSIHCEYMAEKTKAKLSLTAPFVSDHDLTFDVYYFKPYEAKVYIERGCSDKAGILKRDVAMVNFYPELTEDNYSGDLELIFVVDRSGSMSNTRIESAKETLLLLLKSLPVGCYFNIVSFGSRHEALFPDGSVQYGEETLSKACVLQSTMRADLGGTEILTPLRDIYSKPPMSTHARQIFLLTDGEVTNTEQVINLVEKHAENTKVFAFGIGEGASTTLINGVARAGRGKAEFVTGSDRLQTKVMKTMKAAMQASVTDLSLVTVPDIKLVQIPQHIPPIFSGDKLVMYAMGPEAEQIEKMTFTLKGRVGGKPFETTTSDVCYVSATQSDSLSIHRLAAKVQIKELEGKEIDGNKSKIVMLSTSANIISKYTSMVGVDKEKAEKIGTLIHHHITREHHAVHAFGGYGYSAAACSASATPDGFMAMCSAPDTYSFNSRSRSKKRSKTGSSVLSSIMAPARAMFGKAKGKGAMEPVGAAVACGVPSYRSSNQIEISCYEDLCVSDDNSEEGSNPTLPDHLHLIALQAFCGSWKLDQKLAQTFGKDLKELETAMPISNKDVWATVLAVVFLEQNCLDKKDEWEMVVWKAEKWIKEQVLDGNTLASLQAKAKALGLKRASP